MAKIFPIPAFKDNYIWTWFDEPTKSAWVVDPGDSKPVIAALEQAKLDLAGILITHHHQDHTGGVRELVERWPAIPVLGSYQSPISDITQPLRDGDKITCGSREFHILEIPGHTLDHIAFYNEEVLFCGDTLFSAGCGRVFEGTPPQMVQSLNKLKQLPNAILMYCGHEYTLANLKFSQQVEPHNKAILIRLEDAVQLREEGLPTLPALLGKEKLYNPFLRCNEVEVRLTAEKHLNQALDDEVAVFTALRSWKNSF